MRKFNDTDDEQAGIRLADLCEVARRIQRLGVSEVTVDYTNLLVAFHDRRIGAQVTLEIEPYVDGLPGWLWYAHIRIPGGISMGPLARGRWILCSPYPRQVIRAYHRELRWELRPPPRKMNKGR